MKEWSRWGNLGKEPHGNYSKWTTGEPGSSSEERDSRGVLRFLRRHVRHLSADSGFGARSDLLRRARDGYGREVDSLGFDLRGHAPRPAYRLLYLRTLRRRDRQEAHDDHSRERLWRGDAAHGPAAGLPAVGHSGGDHLDRLASGGRHLPRRGVHLGEPAGNGVLPEGEAWVLQRGRHERLPAGLRHHIGDHDGPAPLYTGRRHRLTLRAVGLEDTFRHRGSSRLRPRLLLRSLRGRVRALRRGRWSRSPLEAVV